jgi:PAS domain S-box-containing protein
MIRVIKNDEMERAVHGFHAMSSTLEAAHGEGSLVASLRAEVAAARRGLESCQQRLVLMEGVFDYMADAMFVAEPGGRIIDVNPAACVLLGYSREELLMMYPWDFVAGETREGILDQAQTVQRGAAMTVQRVYRTREGVRKVVDLRLTRCDLAGRDLLIVACRDVTEQKRLEDCLRRSEKNLAEGQRLTKTGSWELDFESGNTDWSVETCRIFGFPDPPPSPHYREFRARVRPEDRAGVDRGLRESFEMGEPRPLRYVFVLPGGEQKHIETISQPVRDEQGRVAKLMGTVMDVTDRKRTEEALHRAFEEMQALKVQFQLAIDTIPGLVWSTLPDGHIDFLNQRWREYTGLTINEASGWGWQSAIHPEDVTGLVDYWKSVLASGKPGAAEARLRRFDGVYRWFLFRSVPLYDGSGKLLKWYGTNTDIEDRKWAEALLAGEKRLLEMIARSDELPSILDSVCRLVEGISNGSVCSILLLGPGGTRLWHGAAPSLPMGLAKAVNGRTISPDAGPCGRAAYFAEPVVVADIAADSFDVDYRKVALESGLRACWSTPIISSEGKVLGTFAQYSHEPGRPTPQQQAAIEQLAHLASIAIERKNAAEALRASEKYARGQAEALTRTLDALARESSPDRIVEHVLRTMTHQLGAHSSSVWLRDEISQLMEFEFALEHGEFKTKLDFGLASISPSLPVDEIWPWPEVFRTGKPCVLEDIRSGPDFPWRAHVLAQGVVTSMVVPMLIAGQVAGVIGIRFDQKRAFRAEEMELAQALANQAMLAMQLTRLSGHSRRAAVMAERNRMARDIHDTLAQGFTGIIVQLEAAADASSKGLAKEAEEHVNRAAGLARGSLKEARRSVLALRPQALEEMDLTEALDDLIQKRTVGTPLRAHFTVQGSPRPLSGEGDESLLRISQEVLTNALRHAHATEFRAQLSFLEGETRMELSDNGRGFDPTARYEGLGLVGMRERVEAMGGRLRIESTVGTGTTVVILLASGPSG